MGPEEVAFLQDCFDALQRKQKFPRDSADADAVATALVLAYQRGVRDQDDLLKLARI
jgi:hypothetical protein